MPTLTYVKQGIKVTIVIPEWLFIYFFKAVQIVLLGAQHWGGNSQPWDICVP